MTSRRGASHVRPRPPSSGRPQLQPVKAAAPDRRRVRQHRGLDARRQRAPLVLADAARALGRRSSPAAAFLVASGGIGPVLSTLAGGFASAFDRLTATPGPDSRPTSRRPTPRGSPRRTSRTRTGDRST